MLIVLSPAKKLVEPPAAPEFPASEPLMLDQTLMLMKTTRRLKAKKLKELMGISDKLADLNHQRFQDFTTPFDSANARQALLSFNGDVYFGLDAASLDGADLEFAQQHVAILSGLYGLLRPLDLMQPYRLEMGTRLKTRRGKSLYDFWGDRLSKGLTGLLDAHDDKTIVNLASNEYFKSLRPKKLKHRVVTPSFLNVKEGKARSLFFFIKRARGLMTRWAIRNRVTSPEALKGFDDGGYTFDAGASTEDNWVFSRPQPPPPK